MILNLKEVKETGQEGGSFDSSLASVTGGKMSSEVWHSFEVEP